MQVSARTKQLVSNEFRDVFLRKSKMRGRIFDLSIGIPEGQPPKRAKDAATQAIQSDNMHYAPSDGLPELRAMVANRLRRKNNVDVEPSQIVIVPGTSTGLAVIYLTLLDPGDEVIIMDPYFTPYKYAAAAIGAKIVISPTLSNFQLDLDAIKKRISQRTKIILINTPNNPTGAIYSRDDLSRLAKLAEKHEITIVSDEIYDTYAYGKEHFSIGSIYPNTLTLNGFSKEYCMTGWRVGYIAGPHELIEPLKQVQQYMVFASSTSAQYAAIAALEAEPPSRSTYKRKNHYIKQALHEMGYQVYGADGAYYIFIKTPHGEDCLQFVELAAQKNLLLVPGSAFSERRRHVRISYGGAMMEVEKGLDILAELTRYPV